MTTKARQPGAEDLPPYRWNYAQVKKKLVKYLESNYQIVDQMTLNLLTGSLI
jgi:hypothetical protein